MRTLLALILAAGISMGMVSCAATGSGDASGGYYSAPDPLSPADATEKLRQDYRREFQ